VKANQPELLAALEGAFDDASASPWERRLERAERRRAASLDQGHGRLERRTLVSTTALNDYAGWPGVAQCFRLVRRRTIRGVTATQVAYGITSLGRDRASAKRLLWLTRRHWKIENGLFWVRDATLGEDACRVRRGAAPMVLSTLRNVVVNLLNGAGVTNKAAALRRHAAHPYEALRLVRPSG
jgi:hypothetical protein